MRGSPDLVNSRRRGNAAAARGPNRATASMTVSMRRRVRFGLEQRQQRGEGPVRSRRPGSDLAEGRGDRGMLLIPTHLRLPGQRHQRGDGRHGGRAERPQDALGEEARRQVPGTQDLDQEGDRLGRLGRGGGDPGQGIRHPPGAPEVLPLPGLVQSSDQGGGGPRGGRSEGDQGFDRLEIHLVVGVVQGGHDGRYGLAGPGRPGARRPRASTALRRSWTRSRASRYAS